LVFRSIRFRLTLWYAISLAVVLAASGFGLSLYIYNNQISHVDDRLLLIATDVSAFNLTLHQNPLATDACEQLEAFLRQRNWGEYVQILNERGNIACSSTNLKEFSLPLGKLALQNTRIGIPFLETLDTLEHHPIRMVTFPVSPQDRNSTLIQVGHSLATIEHEMADLRLTFLLVTPAALLLISLGAWLLAGKALSPVARITRTVRRINAENLSQRLPVEETQDEISELVETFNSMLEDLEGAFRRIKQFSGDASHELRTPLTILRGETEVALRWAKDPEEFRKTLASNMEEINRMGRIIEDLLTLAKSESGELPLVLTQFSFCDLIQELYLQARTLAETKRITVGLQLQVTEEIMLRGDELRLRQMFLNLISNAIKYTVDGGRVDIAVVTDSGFVVISIADTGIGIPEEHLPHIFDRFYRIDEARNREDGGTGLGLSIVKWIVDAHHGNIRVNSTPGKGSTFTVILPISGPGVRHPVKR